MKDAVCELVRLVFERGEMPGSLREGVITLIYKKGDKRDVRNWRPITLLNVDYKIVARLVADRVKKVIGSVIGEQQVCAVPGRRISDNLVLLRDVIHYAQSNNMVCLLESVDLEKAYDRVSHQFLFQVLEVLGFPGQMVKVIRGLYLNIVSQVLVNGTLGGSFPVMSGVRQGCPLSPLMFICVMEPLLSAIRKDKVYKGVFVPGSGGKSVKVLAYMDDVVLVCGGVNDVRRGGLQLRLFCSVSGMRVNWSKCQLCGMGRGVQVDGGQVKSVEKMEVLGVSFDRELKGRESFVKASAKLEKKIAFWKLRDLSLTGKVVVIKSVILPILLYAAVVFPAPEVWVKRMTRLLFLFFWGGKMERCSREKVLKNKEMGGYGFPDVGKFLKFHYWLSMMRVLNGGGLGADMAMYLGGSLFSKWGLCGRDLRRPSAWVVPQYYLSLLKLWREWRLGGLGLEVVNKNKLKAWITEKPIPNQIHFLREKESVKVWRNMKMSGVSNRQRDITWFTLMNCLYT